MPGFRNRPSRRAILGSLAAAPFALGIPRAVAAPSGKVVMAFHVTISPAWFDPSTAPPQITPFGVLYALHDALVRAYPGTNMGPALAESWQESEDGLSYEFKLRPNLTFHNGDKLTTEDVKFSFDRYQGAGATEMKEKVARVEIVDPRTIRFHLKEIWPDFMTMYGSTATAAGLVVPKNYIEKVGETGSRRNRSAPAPTNSSARKPGIEVVLEAFDGYWRKNPNIKNGRDAQRPRCRYAGADGKDRRGGHRGRAGRRRRTGRDGQSAAASRRRASTPRASGSSFRISGTRNRRGTICGCGRPSGTRSIARGSARRPASASARRPGSSSRPSWNSRCRSIRSRTTRRRRSSCSPRPAIPNGLDAGMFHAIPGFPTAAEAVVNDLNAAGIRVRYAPMERAAFYADWKAKKFRGLYMTGAGAAGNAANRVETFIYSKGGYANGGYPDIDELYLQQAKERDPKKREEMLHQIQQTDDRPDDVRADLRFPRADGGGAARRQAHDRRRLSQPVAGLRGHRAEAAVGE